MKVLAAMSGGVDSAVAAARMVDAGHDVTGVHLALSKNPQSFRSGARGCCSKEDSHDARRAADMLGIPFYVWDLSDRFIDDVVDDFVAEYAAGRTPNPCLRCNEKIKFAAVLDRGMALGFDLVATGHYAQLREEDGLVQMHRAVDPGKDQSYVLGVLNQQQLRHSAFPLGDSLKTDVRAEADRLGLTVANKPDSHDICFIPDGDTAGFLDARLGSRAGDIVDEAGQKLGDHSGSHHYTIGQRKGLSIGHPADDGRPRYVLSISPVENTVTVGPKDSLQISEIVGIKPSWTGQARTGDFSGMAQVRAHGEPMPADFSVATGGEVAEDGAGPQITVRLAEPVNGIAPGQAVVLYDDDRVIGSATIARTRAAADVLAG